MRLTSLTIDDSRSLSHVHERLRDYLPEAPPGKKVDAWRPSNDSAMRIRVRFLRSVRAERRRRAKRPGVRGRIRPLSTACQYAHHDQHGAPHPHSLALAGPPCGDSLTLRNPHRIVPPVPLFPREGAPLVEFGPSAPVIGADTSMLDDRPRTKSSSSSKSAKSRSLAESVMTGISAISAAINSLGRSLSTKSGNRSANGSSTGHPAPESPSGDRLSRASRSGSPRPPSVATVPKPPTPTPQQPRRSRSSLRRKNSRIKATPEDLNDALFGSCCSHATLALDSRGVAERDDDRLLNAPGCIHKRLLRAIRAQKNEKSVDYLQFFASNRDANMTDEFGNALVSVAARWGAVVPILIAILERTDDITSVNDWGETFLHGYEPPPEPLFGPSSFLDLVGYLRSRGFDFGSRDTEGRTCLQRLVERRGFPVEALRGLFEQLPYESAQFLLTNQSVSGDRLWDNVQRNLEQRAPQLTEVFGDEAEFIRRYLPGLGPQGTAGPGSIPYAAHHPQASEPGSPPGPSTRQCAGAAHDGKKLHPDRARRSALMELFCTIGSTGVKVQTAKLRADIMAIVPGDDPMKYLRLRDREGNTALHYAAEFGLTQAVKILCGSTLGANANSLNNCGNSPLQLVKYAIQRTDVLTDVAMEVRYLLCAVALIEAGAVEQPPKPVLEKNETVLEVLKKKVIPRLGGTKLIDTGLPKIFDGSEDSIANLERDGVAETCKGLHLLASYQAADPRRLGEGVGGPG